MIPVHFNGFWPGFHEYTDANTDKFFIDLLTQVYGEQCRIASLEEAEILVENTRIYPITRIPSKLTAKKWHHTYLFSGESYILPNRDKYTCVLYGQETHGNTVNVPLYISYLYCNNITPRTLSEVPKGGAVAVIGNPNGRFRSVFLSELEKHIPVTYAGNFRKNTTVDLSKVLYSSNIFLDYIGQFKFVVAMENSQEDTYITEKIMHGLLAGTIPIYWGSLKASNYINPKRFIQVHTPEEFVSVSERLKQMTGEEWTSITREPIFTELGKTYTLEAIASQVKNVLAKYDSI